MKKKITTKKLPFEGNHPVFEEMAEEIAQQVAFQINQRTMIGKIDRKLRNKVRYPAQLVLEIIIKKLEAAVLRSRNEQL